MTVPSEPPRDRSQDPGYGPPSWGPPPPSGPPPVYGSVPYGPPGQQRPENAVWAVLAHLSIFALGLVGPLAIYLVFRDTSPFTRQHAAEALNFHLTLLIATIVSTVLVIVLVGLVLLLALMAWGAVLAIVAAVAAADRRPYRYPLTFRFVS